MCGKSLHTAKKINIVKIILIFLVFFVYGAYGFEYSPNIRINKDIDHILQHLSSVYNIPLPYSYYCQPMQVSHIVEFLDSVESMVSNNNLSSQERFQINRLKMFVNRHINRLVVKNKKKDIESKLNADLVGVTNVWHKDSLGFAFSELLRPQLKGHIGKLSYYSEVDVWVESESDSLWRVSTFQPYDGVPYVLFGRASESHSKAVDMIRAGVTINSSVAEFETAVDYVKFGPAVFNPLTFSAEAPPLTYFRTTLDLSIANYSHFIGLLRSQKDKPKYFYAHRLTFPIFKNKVVFGLNEVIVYGSTADSAQTDPLREEYYGRERDWEWVYMIPFMPFTFVEHYVGDMDNSLLSFDISIRYPKHFRWYTEILLDDITNPITIFSNDWGNKWAVTSGVQYFGHHFGKDLSAIIEYTRVEPWVYTHFYGVSHRYTHFGQSLGASAGPNSDDLHISLESEINNKNTIGITFRRNRKNSTTRGGSIEDVFQDDVDSETKVFLGEGTVSHNSVELLWKVSPFGRFKFWSILSFKDGNQIGIKSSLTILL